MVDLVLITYQVNFPCTELLSGIRLFASRKHDWDTVMWDVICDAVITVTIFSQSDKTCYICGLVK